ncbi:MAG: HlyD family efflux transporter periplasmic adaptor subunit [Campylobacteraceae bacterium]|jgi:HlyD family secretion protein|nr:HlyD family efflux transporter periplasmic adaptor subunit [Campylobacteraceae bacterium]
MKKVFGYIFLVMIIAAIAAAFFYIYKDTNGKELSFSGNVDTRTVNLGFRFLGKIDKIYKDEGDSVVKDEILASLDSKNLQNNINEVRARLSAEKIKLDKLKKGFRKEDIEEAKGELESALANFKLLEDILKRQERLVDKNATSQESYINALYKYEAAEGTLRKAEALYAMRKKGYEEEDIKAQKALVESLEAALKAALQDLEDSVIKSPFDGVILTRLKEDGAIVNPGERILELSRQDEFWVKAYVDEPHLGAISQGDEVLVYADVRKEPYIGVIGNISPIAEFTPKNIETIELRSDLVYRFRVLLKEPDKKIKQGMPVTIKLKK